MRPLAGLFLAWCAVAAAQEFDLILEGGRVVDGTGNPSFVADVGVRDGRIAALGRLRGRAARRRIDVRGKVVAPGFVDIHNHSDFTILVDGGAQSMIRQGVTSMILGEGGSAAPRGGKQQDEDVFPALLRKAGTAANWTDLAGYFAAVLARGVAPNIGTYVGSSQIWTYVRGPRAGPPTAEEREQMRAQVRLAMRQGALGVASSLSGPPGSWIDTQTLVEMCQAAGEHGGIYSTHMRTEGFGVFEAVAEAIDIGARAGVPVDIIHLKIAERKLWGQMPELIGSIASARARGQQVEAHVYPYRAGQNNLAAILPPWAHEGGPQALVVRLKDPAMRPRLEREILHGIPGSNWYNHYTATGGWDGMLLASLANPKYRAFQGKRMSEVIQTLGVSPVDALFRTLIDNDGSVPTVYFHHDEKDMQYAMRQPFVSIGSDGAAVAAAGPLAEGHPHPRFYGTFPRVLGRYVREQKLLTIEEAVRKMTSANAAKVRLYDRGLLRPGMWADVTVFDPEAILDQATYEQPHQYPIGVDWVIVNGTVVLAQGKDTGAPPGRILYGPGYDGKTRRNGP